ncbi:hypothetical protein P168DRAFT_314687 [Aspergillus campestris IBT 28561]|uniref:Rhodopsin domain-containing protein n=1 Tax=Aspergillus campestris (strain IBT 28561) TaxID=1392248 RepID=A0A2I1DFG0_ASPC2|nr:uncharacterized protein P168DRAFT_314687 [Aspergillus campestris IBT 28561]PKY08615.1 hypothetical protein P168DRAFT_314687 [Aspergillus campestris IBT 28561]
MAALNTNVDFSETRGPEVNIVGWVFTGVAIVAVFLRLYARVKIVKRVGWDDFFIVFSLILSIVATAMVSYSVTLGFGRHTAAVVAEHGMARTVVTAKWQILAFPFNIGSFSFPNIAISILVSNLLDPNIARKRFLYGLSIVQVLFALISVVIVFVQCNPTQRLWNPALHGSCWNPAVFDDFQYWVSAYTTVTDIILAVVPISAFWNLQMAYSKKVIVCVMMGLTLMSAVVTVVKATYLHLFTDKVDPLYNLVPLVLWGLIEQNVVIVAACVPAFHPLLRRIFKLAQSTSANSGSSRSKSAFPLSSSSRRSNTKTLTSASDLPLDDRRKPRGDDTDSLGSREGIWQTREVRVESDEDENDPDTRSLERRYRSTVPANLRTR